MMTLGGEKRVKWEPYLRIDVFNVKCLVDIDRRCEIYFSKFIF